MNWHNALPFLTADDIEALESLATERQVPSETTLILEAGVSPGLFLLRDGELRVEKEYLGTPIPISVLNAGSVFGEMSLVDGLAASATVVAESACSISLVPTESLEAALRADPAFAGRFFRSVASLIGTRLRESNGSAVSAYG